MTHYNPFFYSLPLPPNHTLFGVRSLIYLIYQISYQQQKLVFKCWEWGDFNVAFYKNT